MGNVGTTIKVEHLFYNTPARLNYLKSAKTEYSKIYEFLHAISLAYPQVSFAFRHDSKEVFFKPANEDLKSRLYGMYGQEFVEGLRDLSVEMTGMKFSGYTSDPKTSFANKNRQFFFVNHRLVFSPIVARAISDAYNRFIPHGNHPAYVLFLDIDPTSVDVNVHPRKQEVRFENESQVFRIVHQSLQSLLEKTSLFTASDDSFGEDVSFTTSPTFSQTVPSPSTPSYHTGKGSVFAAYSPYKNLAPNPSQSTIHESVSFTKELLKSPETPS